MFVLVVSYAVAGTWTTINFPDAVSTHIAGIDGDTVVGSYTTLHWDERYGEFLDTDHNYVYTIPEPTTLLLLGMGGLLFRKRK